MYSLHFYHMAVIFKGRARSKVEAHVIGTMASTSETTRTRKKAISLDADVSTSDLLDFSSSEESDNDVVTSDFSSDEEVSSDQPGMSAVSRDVAGNPKSAGANGAAYRSTAAAVANRDIKPGNAHYDGAGATNVGDKVTWREYAPGQPPPTEPSR
ncbi:hypothetical protein MRX96_005808 [Rhipicephalus microplus]